MFNYFPRSVSTSENAARENLARYEHSSRYAPKFCYEN